ncbi:putative E3 ubiquitin-protein ligase ATL44 [Iris pallida]|uniref:E3 ubiquitin-protein ligase ATL44 n=1 Tax=Iris pallida TaxID=29817 RepID=A0AAX6GH99_IRIPA|nr:putative E3 ubiquitin-protein ligase ATL44 [Iris pallida]
MIMAGMLPGVESARRRRMRPSGTASSQSGSRRSSFCLYATGSSLISVSTLCKGVAWAMDPTVARSSGTSLGRRRGDWMRS